MCKEGRKMTINDIVWLMRSTERYQRGAAKPEHPNGAAVSHPDMPDDGLDITGMTAADRKIIPVSKEAEQAMKDIAFDHMKRYYGMSGTGNELGDTIKSYYKQIPPSDRARACLKNRETCSKSTELQWRQGERRPRRRRPACRIW